MWVETWVYTSQYLPESHIYRKPPRSEEAQCKAAVRQNVNGAGEGTRTLDLLITNVEPADFPWLHLGF